MSANVEVFRATGTDDTGTAFGSINRNIEKTKRNADKLNGSLRMMRGGMGQLGHQIQDVSVQLQMGQNPLMVLTQQGSQVASLFGPTGAVIGAIGAVAGALAGAFLPRLFETSDKVRDLHEATQDLGSLMTTEAATGLTVYAGKMKEVAENSKAAAREIRSAAIAAAEKAMIDLSQSLSATADNLQRGTVFAVRGVTRLTSAAATLGISEQQFQALESQISALDPASEESREAVLDLLAQFLAIQRSTGPANERLKELTDNFLSGHNEMTKLNRQLEKFADVTAPSVEKGADKAAKKFERFVDTLQRSVQKSEGMTPAQMAAIQLQSMEGLTDAEKRLATDLIRRLRQTELTADATKRKAAADRDAAKAATELARSQKAQADADAKEIAGAGFAEGIVAAANAKRKKNAKLLEEMRIGFLSEMDLLQEQESAKRDFINGLADSYFTEEMTREQMLTDLAQEYSNKRNAIHQEEAEKRRSIQAAGNAVIQQGLQFMAQNLKEGSALQKTAFLATRAFAASEAIVSAELAAAKVLAHDAGILGLGAIASSNLIRGVGYASAAMIMAQAVASFEGGGFTGRGPRSGGIDGRGGFLSILHPNESIYDHTKGQGMGVTIVNNIDARGSGPDVDMKIRKAVEQGNKQTIGIIRDLAGRGRLV